MMKKPITSFLKKHYRHFNAASLVDAAKAYDDQLKNDHKMMITMAGAMSTAELGISLAEMIRKDKVHIITCTGANLEEDIFNLVAHKHYKRIPNYRDLNPADEKALLDQHYNRVTDTCIPEMEAMRRIENQLLDVWSKAKKERKRYFPHEYLYQIIRSGSLDEYIQINPKDSWMVAACEKNIPIIVPGWEDSTTGNMFAAHCMMKKYKPSTVKSGIEYMMFLAEWYQENAKDKGVGFFQIGGGIAGDFPICVVPMLRQDMELEDTPFWSYFCQISDSTTSYGSYSGAVPNEKITWEKIDVDTPTFVIESDATIVAPLIFGYLLGW
ncbi:MAG: deoxyhypusine synthase family protein [Saprospiraceae bacterium]